MKSIDRRHFMKMGSLLPFAISLIPAVASAEDCRVEHPFIKADSRFQGQCPVCGMLRPMWARTWITFDTINDVSQVCSFHCLADWALNSGQDPKNVMLTIYHQPERSIPASQAFIVLGSTAAGTMSPVSKIVFDEKAAAERFAAACGGAVVDYSKALLTAKTSAHDENKTINAHRIEKGIIVEPDAKDHCTVCGMYPQRYPYGKSQVRSRNGETKHFCSTQCLFAFLGRQTQYVNAPIDPFLIWVVDRNTGLWISGRTAFYVIGSAKIFGPMGYEAFPFNSLQEAEAFTVENGGRTAVFKAVTIDKVVPMWRYPSRD